MASIQQKLSYFKHLVCTVYIYCNLNSSVMSNRVECLADIFRKSLTLRL